MVSTPLKTIDDLLMLENRGERFELIEGVFIEIPFATAQHGFVLANLTYLIGRQTHQNDLGSAYSGGVGVLLTRSPDTVLGPDFAVVASARLPLEDPDFMVIPPDWAMEVFGSEDALESIEQKLGLYLDHGVKSVWIVYPDSRRVVIHAPATDPQVFSDAGVSSGIAPFPTVTVRVSEIFGDS
jgi:Uma2 family endonuclease